MSDKEIGELAASIFHDYLRLHVQGKQAAATRSVVRKLKKAMSDATRSALAKDKKFTYCAYCGFTVAIDEDGSIIANHIRNCAKHPARLWEAEARLETIKNWGKHRNLCATYLAAGMKCSCGFNEEVASLEKLSKEPRP